MRSTSNFERPPFIQNTPRAWYLPPTFRKGYRKAPAFFPIAIARVLGRSNLAARSSRSAREPDYNLLDFGALENEKELPLRKNAQVDAILRQKSKGKPENFVSIDIKF
jgi:hypothetical protein